MDINISVKRGQRIRANYLFFVIAGIQIGLGVLSAPRDIFEKAQQDAWLSIIIAYLFMLLVTIVMFIILSRYKNADIFGIQVDVFGKWFGKFLGTIYLLFLTAELLSVLLTYTDVIKIFIFPTIPSSIISIMLLILIAYSVTGGIRVVIGVVFLFTLLSPWFMPLLYDPILRIETSHFLPMFEASFSDLLKGARVSSYTFLGLEILLFIYPFIDNKEKAKRPTYLGLTASAFIVLTTTIISIGYFSPNNFHNLDWPVLILFKSVSFSFMERFDYFIVSGWLMITIPTAVLFMWAIMHGTKRIFRIQPKKTLTVISVTLLALCTIFSKPIEVQKVSDIVSQVGFWIVFVYPFILLPFVLLKTKRKTSKEVQKQHD